MADEVVLPIPNLTLPQDFFTLSSQSLSHLHENARTHLVQAIKEDRM
jgi:26S proteasome regulatory subunit N7